MIWHCQGVKIYDLKYHRAEEVPALGCHSDATKSLKFNRSLGKMTHLQSFIDELPIKLFGIVIFPIATLTYERVIMRTGELKN